MARIMPPNKNQRKGCAAQSPKPLHCKQGCDVIDRLAAYEARMSGVSREDKELLIPALGWRSYHLPGYSYCDDWLQFFQNNHPLISICCHHKLHPIGFGMRLVFLFGSIVFGLMITNISWLMFYYSGTDQNEPAITITLNPEELGASTNSDDTFQITQGMLLLWTVGGLLHATFDNTIWYVTACACCIHSRQHHRFKLCGSYCVMVIVVFVTAMATLAVLLRTTIETEEQQQQQGDTSTESNFAVTGVATEETVTKIRFQEAESYRFLLSYATELVLALVVYNPIIGTVLFCGILGCGRLPILGGRPYEVLQEEQRLREERLGSSSSTIA
jgi:hypothetical protein